VRGGPSYLASRWFCRLGLDGDVPDHSITFSRPPRRLPRDDLLPSCSDRGGALHDGRIVGAKPSRVDASIHAVADANRRRARPDRGLDPTSIAQSRNICRFLMTRLRWPPPVEAKTISPTDPAPSTKNRFGQLRLRLPNSATPHRSELQ